MRQVKKARIVFFILGLLLGCAILGGVGYFMITSRDSQISTLMEQRADGGMLAFTRNIKANSEILPGDVIGIEAKASNVANGGYFGDVIGEQEVVNPQTGLMEKKTVYGNWRHYVLLEDGTSTFIPMTEDDLVGKIVKADVYVNQPVSDSVLYPDKDVPSESERYVEFNFIQIPSDVLENDYIDVRIQFPTGEDYLVLVGKKVVKARSQEYRDMDANTIFLKLTEDEILQMGSAIIEAYMDDGVRLYARKYIDPATQLFDEKEVDYVAKYNEGMENAIKAKTIEKARAQMVKNGDATREAGNAEIVNGELIATLAAYEGLDEEQKNTLLTSVTPATKNDVSDEYLAAQMGVRESLVRDIRSAIDSNNVDKLNYFKTYRVQIDKRLARTYPAKKEILTLIKVNPNLLNDIISDFTAIADNNTRQDELEKLRAQYEEAPYASTLPYGTDTSKVKTKESIQQEILNLENKRKENIKGKLDEEQQKQRSERLSYLASLFGSSNAGQ